MEIILKNGTKINDVIKIESESRVIEGVHREILRFVFNDFTDLNSFNNLFTEYNCEEITIVDKRHGEYYVHRGYTIVHNIQKYKSTHHSTEQVVLSAELCKRTYTEERLDKLLKNVKNIELAITSQYENNEEEYENVIANIYKDLIDDGIRDLNNIPKNILPNVIELIKNKSR